MKRGLTVEKNPFIDMSYSVLKCVCNERNPWVLENTLITRARGLIFLKSNFLN